MPDNPVATPSRASSTNVPHPAGTELPVNEKPRTVEPPVDTVNPASAASPPLALLTVVPSILNWKPPVSY